jgi:hypothetical protein
LREITPIIIYMSDASNLGTYGPPNANARGIYANNDGANNAQLFTNPTVPNGPNEIANPYTNNVNAANASQMGGKRRRRSSRRKRNIRKSSRSRRNMRKRKSMRKGSKKRKHKHSRSCTHSQRHRLRGGYHQFGSNVPISTGYSTGGVLPSNLSALANPVPFKPIDTLCADYKH